MHRDDERLVLVLTHVREEVLRLRDHLTTRAVTQEDSDLLNWTEDATHRLNARLVALLQVAAEPDFRFCPHCGNELVAIPEEGDTP